MGGVSIAETEFVLVAHDVYLHSTVSLYIMSQWVGSNELATPTQQHAAREVSMLTLYCLL